jgi:hypothetical protein
MGLRGAVRGRAFKRTTVTDDAAPRPLDLVQREFRAIRPNQLWIKSNASAGCKRTRVGSRRAALGGTRRL